MKRLNLLGSWKRIGVQAGLLAGLGLAFAGTADKPAVAGMGDCPLEDECTFKKPNFMIILDYSTSMNESFGDNISRWEAAAGAVQNLMIADQNYLSENMHVALMRFGHDPNPNSEGTLINNDSSGIEDGQKLDVHWYDLEGDDKTYYECNGQAIIDAVDALPAPIDGNLTGIGTWTNGALQYAQELIEQSIADHPSDVPSMDNRYYGLLVMTDGDWTNANGMGQTPSEAPSNTAADLLAGVGPENQPVQTFAVFFGEEGSSGEMSAQQLAMAGGTMNAILATDQMSLTMALTEVVNTIKDQVQAVECIGGLPRIMVILDASSSMLNIGGGAMPAPQGESGWDLARAALAGDNSIFEVEVNVGSNQVVEDLVHLGLLVFGHNSPAPGEQKILVNYGPCMKDNFRWALAPQISHPNCAAPDYTPLLDNQDYVIPDCADPWNGPPITWEFEQIVGGLPDPNSDPAGPGFDADTQTHMPKCEGAGPACSGSGTYTHLGLELAASNQAQYHADQLMLGNVDDGTQYRNILITDGQYNGYSTDGQVQGALEGMYNSGITTYVIGFGDGVNTPAAMQQLQNMAQWGSGGNENYIDADNQQELEMALAGIIEQISFDPCCAFNDCSEVSEPTTGEPDPEPGQCATDADCKEGEICVIPGMAMFGTCEPDVDCMNDEDCGPGQVCTDEGMCVTPPCMSDDDCDADEVCNTETGICEAAPCTIVPCEGNLVCNEETGECQPGVCPDDFQCQDGEACVDGMCVIQSCPDVPCEDGFTCNNGVCEPDDPTDATGTESDSDTGTTAGPTTGTPTTSTTDDGTTGDGTDTDTDSASTTTGEDDEGCGCTTTADENKARGLFGTLMALGFAGFIRRRRRS